MQKDAGGRGKEAEAALGGTGGAEGGEKVYEHGKDLTLPWVWGPGDMRRAEEGKGRKPGGNQSSLIALLMESIYTNTTL